MRNIQGDVRQISLYYQKNIMDNIPNDFPVAPCYLEGYSKEEFIQGVFGFRGMLDALFGRYVEYGAEREKDLDDVLEMLDIFGFYGVIDDCHVKLQYSDELCKATKKARITNIGKRLRVLESVGFKFGDLDLDKFSLNEFEILDVCYPESPFVCLAWSAFSKACQKLDRERTLFHCDYRVFQKSDPKAPKAMLSDCIGSLSEDDKLFIIGVDQYLIENGYKLDVHKHNLKGTYSHKKSGFPIVIFYINVNVFQVRIIADGINKYFEFFKDLPQEILENCVSCADCVDCCPTCRGGMEFNLDRHYRKCRAKNFTFPVDNQNREILRELIVQECEARKEVG